MADKPLTLSHLFIRIEKLESELEALKEAAYFLKSKTPSDQAVTDTKPAVKAEITPTSAKVYKDFVPKPNVLGKWEGFLGENLFIKLGLLSMLLGAIWFLNLAFTEYWINESVRIWLGLFAGVFLVAQGIRLLKNWPLIGPGLVGTGVSLSFASYFVGYFNYDLYELNTTFVGLFLLSLVTIGLSYALASEVIFGFGLLGAFLVPTLLSTGQNSYQFLFIYLLFWNLIFLVISKKTQWRIVPLLLLFGNHIVFAGWADTKLSISSWEIPLLFQVSIFTIFLIREHLLVKRFTEKDTIFSAVTVALSLLLTYIQAYWISSIFFPEFQKGLLISLIVLYYGFYLKSLPKENSRQSLVSIFHGSLGLIGTLFLLSALVIGFEGRSLSIVTLSFATLISVIGARSKIISVYILALLFWFVGILNLILSKNWNGDEELFLLNGRFALYVLAAVLLYLFSRLGKELTPVTSIYKWSAFPVLLLGSFIDVDYNINPAYQLLGYTAFLGFYGITFTSISLVRPNADLRKLGLFCLGLVILKLYLYDFWNMGIIARIFAGFGLGAILFITGIMFNRQKKKIQNQEEL